MNAKISLIVIFCAFIALAILVAGFVFSGAGTGAPTPVPAATSTPGPGATATPAPGSGGTTVTPTVAIPTPTPAPGACPTPGSGATGTPTPVPSPTAIPTPTPVPVWSATTSDWGSDKDSYPRGSTAVGWVYVTNTGNVPITQIDFTIVIKRTIFFYTLEKVFTYNATGFSIPPGSTQQVAFSIEIPYDYEGISTAGRYQLTATAFLSGTSIGSYSKYIDVT